MEIIGLGKAELAELGLNFISVKVPVFPVLHTTYTVKMQFFKTIEELKETLSNVTPLIVFDTTGVYESQPRVNPDLLPPEIISNGSGFYVRAVIDINPSDWRLLRSNIAESDNHNFTFKWDTEHYSDPVIDKAKEKAKKTLEMQSASDLKEAEYLKVEGKKHSGGVVKTWV